MATKVKIKTRAKAKKPYVVQGRVFAHPWLLFAFVGVVAVNIFVAGYLNSQKMRVDKSFASMPVPVVAKLPTTTNLGLVWTTSTVTINIGTFPAGWIVDAVAVREDNPNAWAPNLVTAAPTSVGATTYTATMTYLSTNKAVENISVVLHPNDGSGKICSYNSGSASTSSTTDTANVSWNCK